MGWASDLIRRLRKGETVSFRPRGHSMSGRIKSGQLCTVAPTHSGDFGPGDVVLCRVRGREYLHLVKAIRNSQALIANNRGDTNGWTPLTAVFGKLVSVSD